MASWMALLPTLDAPPQIRSVVSVGFYGGTVGSCRLRKAGWKRDAAVVEYPNGITAALSKEMLSRISRPCLSLSGFGVSILLLG